MNEEQNNQINQLQQRINNAYFSKECTLLSGGVIINAKKKEESVDVIITNEDIVDIFNAINEDVPFDKEENTNETSVSSDNSEPNEL